MRIIKRWCIYSENSGNHIISLLDDDTYACDCIGWTRHFPRKDCKHIREVKNGGGIELDENTWNALNGKKHKVLGVLNMFKKMEGQGIDTQSIREL
jgi:hypothetical protein